MDSCGRRANVKTLFVLFFVVETNSGLLEKYFPSQRELQDAFHKHDVVQILKKCLPNDDVEAWERGVREKRMNATLCKLNANIGLLCKIEGYQNASAEYLKMALADAASLCKKTDTNDSALRVVEILNQCLPLDNAEEWERSAREKQMTASMCELNSLIEFNCKLEERQDVGVELLKWRLTNAKSACKRGNKVIEVIVFTQKKIEYVLVFGVIALYFSIALIIARILFKKQLNSCAGGLNERSAGFNLV